MAGISGISTVIEISKINFLITRHIHTHGYLVAMWLGINE